MRETLREKLDRLKEELKEDYEAYHKSPIRNWEDRRDDTYSILDAIFRLFGK